MSNRLSKGRAVAGSFAQDNPGEVFGGVQFSSAGTTAVCTSFKFPLGAVIEDVFVKVTTASSSTQTISIGLATGTSSAGLGTALISSLVIPSTGVWLACASTSNPSVSFSYGTYMVSCTSETVTILKRHAVGSTDTYQYLNFTCSSTVATAGTIYPIFYELL